MCLVAAMLIAATSSTFGADSTPPASAAPAAATTDAPDVAALLAQMRRAAGGDAWNGVRALHIIAEADSGGSQIARERWQDVSAGRYTLSETDAHGGGGEGFDGITPWRLGRSGIAYALGDVDAGLVAADEAFRVTRAWWFRDRHAATIARLGSRDNAGRHFDVLQVTPEGGRAFEAWIDQNTHLLARTDEQQAEERVVTEFDDYRDVQGLMLPFTVRSGDGSDARFDDVERVRSIEVNRQVADARYALPPLPASDIVLPPGRDHVDVPFRLTFNNRIMLPLTLDGHVAVEAELDSGGSLLLQPGAVARLGTASTGAQKQTGGGEGATTSSTGRLGSLQLGGARVPSLSFHSFAFHPDAPDEALVGLELLQRFVVRLDFDRNVMTLTRPDAFHYAGPGAIVPFHFQDNQPEVRGTIDGIAGLFALDTGDNGSLLLIAPFARRYGLVERYQADIPYGSTAVGVTHGVWARKRVHEVTLAGADGRAAVSVRDPVTRASLQHSGFDANRNVSANIGLGILRQFNLTFDYPRQRLILEPNHFHGQPDVFNRSGVRLKRDGERWVVATVYPDGPAAQAGIVVGDHVRHVDGRTPAQTDDAALDAQLKRAPGTRVVLDVEHEGSAPKAVALVLRDVL